MSSTGCGWGGGGGGGGSSAGGDEFDPPLGRAWPPNLAHNTTTTASMADATKTPWNPRITTAAAHAAAVSAADATKTPRRFIDLKGVMRHEKRLRLFGKRKQIQLFKLHAWRSAPGGARTPHRPWGAAARPPAGQRRRGSGGALPGRASAWRGAPRFVCCTRQAGRGGRPLAKPRRAGGRPDAQRPVWQAPVRARGPRGGPGVVFCPFGGAPGFPLGACGKTPFKRIRRNAGAAAGTFGWRRMTGARKPRGTAQRRIRSQGGRVWSAPDRRGDLTASNGRRKCTRRVRRRSAAARQRRPRRNYNTPRRPNSASMESHISPAADAA